MSKKIILDEDLVKEMYLKDKMKIKDIAEHFNCSVYPIKKILKNHTNRRKLSDILTKEDLYRMYFIENMSLVDIARHYKTTDVTIGNYFKKFEIPVKMGRKKIELDIEEILKLYDEGFSCEKISKVFDTTVNTIIDRVTEHRDLRDTSYYVSGEKCHLWRGGKADEARWTAEYREWRKSVFERDGYTCQKCKDDKGGNLEAHHILNFSKYKDIRYDINNGITLCKVCHNPNEEGSFHSIYGVYNNTKEQLEEFLGRELNY
ncbi:HNH endonuclease [Bacillus phage PBC2]|uniref:Putative HNH endonuclease n=1 Tax=Bacillus phage PBC2 TaxID=1675029 RepID=A0A218KCC2_9CAUD|nr:HNH endonuclease [Bacillus phage PBC2]AKQ08542.1 putative HNH endonuclease [Bacillus phage PBC2]